MKEAKKGLGKRLSKLFIFLIACSILISFSSAVSASQITVDTNRYVVLDDPNTGTVGAGFFNPSAVRGGSWNSNLWSGESTTIRAVAVVVDNTGSPLSGATVTFRLRNPGGTINTATIASSSTDSRGIAYYSFNMNGTNYWGYWKVEANVTVGGTDIQNSTSFASNWWGCAQCHNNKVGGNTLKQKFGSYVNKSYYVMGANFHNTSKNSAHINAMKSGACIVCHQSYNGTAKNWGFINADPNIPTHKEYSPDWHNGKVSCQDCHNGSNFSAVPGNSENQIKNPDIAGCYDTAGCHAKKNTNLKKINTTTGFVLGGNYKANYSDIQNSNVAKAHSDTRVECIVCHGAGHNISKPYNALASSNANTENEQCWACHTKRIDTHFGEACTSCHSQDAHNVSIGGSGPDCKSCHDIGNGAPAHVNFTVANSTDSIHSNINYQAGATVDPGNKKCWACHGNGSQPTEHPVNYKTPFRCEDCHVTRHNLGINCNVCHDTHDGGIGLAIIPYVQQHNQRGISINTSTSCYQCHNRSEMLLTAIDPDSGTVYGGTNGGVNSPSHYGKKRTDMVALQGSSYCSYCHNNSANRITFYVSEYNSSIVNHSVNSTTPLCTTCHGIGRLHDYSLSKPVGSDSLCKTCHIDKNEHKNLYCTECHANNSVDGSISGRDIHGIKFLQKDNTFSQNRGGDSADCTTCHQKNVVDSSLGLFAPPKVNDPLHHSDDTINGSKWGNYWTGTNPIIACMYCHNDTRHSSNPLGRPLTWNSSYVLNTPINGGTNCNDCHYKGDTNYVAMNSAFTGSGLEVPPEITNGSWNGKSGYFNHSFGIGEYTDIKCKQCHDSGVSSTVGQMMHRATIGGGEDCISCHNNANPASSLVVDINIFNNSIHQNINKTPINTVNNRDCWSCHFNKDMNRANINKCKVCHSKPQQWHGNAIGVSTNLTELSTK